MAGEIGAKSLTQDSEKASLMEYEQIVRKRIESKIKAALKVQARWIGLSDDEWDREIDVLRDLSTDEFLDFIKAEFKLGILSIWFLKTTDPYPKRPSFVVVY